jgi:hypothetical protein
LVSYMTQNENLLEMPFHFTFLSRDVLAEPISSKKKKNLKKKISQD